MHYARKRQGIPLDWPRYYNVNRNVDCEFSGCEREVKAKGLCRAHYQQRYVRKLPLMPIRHREPNDLICDFDGCSERAIGKRFCSLHYGRNKFGRRMDAPVGWQPPRPNKRAICEISECSNYARRNGMCVVHHTRWRRGDRGERLARPLRGRSGIKSALTIAMIGMEKEQKKKIKKISYRPECAFPGCKKIAKSKALCSTHYHQKYSRGLPLTPIRKRKPKAFIPLDNLQI